MGKKFLARVIGTVEPHHCGGFELQDEQRSGAGAHGRAWRDPGPGHLPPLSPSNSQARWVGPGTFRFHSVSDPLYTDPRCFNLPDLDPSAVCVSGSGF